MSTQAGQPGLADVVVLGIFAADLVFRAPRMPAMGETLLGEDFSIGAGGKGSNQAIAAARAAARPGRVSFVTRIGKDTFGDFARAVWAEKGVSTDQVIIDPEAPTGAAFIFVSSRSGNNAIIVNPGSAGNLSSADIDTAKPVITGAKVFVTQLEQPLETALHGLAVAKAAGVTTIFNPAPARLLPDAIWPLCDWVTPNESEAALLSGVPVESVADAVKAARVLLTRGAGNVLMTLGDKGALLADGNGFTLFACLPGVQVVDTTGAGDAFNGGFAMALAEGRAPQEAIRFATALAGLSVSRAGAAASMPDRAEIEAAEKLTLPPVTL